VQVPQPRWKRNSCPPGDAGLGWRVDVNELPLPVHPGITAETEIVAIGGALSPTTLQWAYATGAFPMPTADGDSEVAQWVWFSPDPRAVLAAPGMRISRSLRKSMRHFTTTIDADFPAVLAGCADPARPHGWMTNTYQQVYRNLAAIGVAHSIEVWQEQELVGGLIAVEVGGLVCADSKFRRVTDASKAAVARLSAEVFERRSGQGRLIDAQWPTAHLLSLGFQAWPRARYLREIRQLRKLPPVLAPSF